jgi:acetamidase/formamidase
VLAVRFISLRPDTWGYTVAAGRDTPLTRRLGLHEGPPAWLLWQIDADTRVAISDRGPAVRIAPFHGVTGVAWDEPGEHSTIPPRAVGARRPVPGVHAVTPAGQITFGFSPDLNAAMGDALDAMLTWLQASYGVGKATALALASPVLDLRVTQVATATARSVRRQAG